MSNRQLFSSRADAISQVNSVLRPLGKKMWRVSELDGLKLTKLLVWSERYSVSLNYIVETVLSGLSKAVERRTGRKSKTGLGVTVSVLTGEVAKQILLERIAKDFPGGENKHKAAEDRKEYMLAVLDDDLLGGRPKAPLSYAQASMFTSAYKAMITRKRREREELEEKISAMPFRGNCFVRRQ